MAALDEAADDAERVRELAEALDRRARQDPAFAQALETWRRAGPWPGTTPNRPRNEISGGTFQGPVVQARDVNGPLSFGG